MKTFQKMFRRKAGVTKSGRKWDPVSLVGSFYRPYSPLLNILSVRGGVKAVRSRPDTVQQKSWAARPPLPARAMQLAAPFAIALFSAVLLVSVRAIGQPIVTERASVSTAGVQANADSFNPSFSADGHWVAFESLAGNLAANDTNFKRDVF